MAWARVRGSIHFLFMKYSIGDVSPRLTRAAAALAFSSKSSMTWVRTISSASQPRVAVRVYSPRSSTAYRAFFSPCIVLIVVLGYFGYLHTTVSIM